jgi:hypothetical protein
VTTTPRHPRRVVIGPGRGGADVAYDNIAVSLESDATTISDVWLTQRRATPTDWAPETTPWSLLPAEDGTTWRIVEFKGGRVSEDITSGMHQTPTVDLGMILSGRVRLVLEDASTVELTAGDYFVLRGIPHTWSNPWEESCIVSIVLVRSQ